MALTREHTKIVESTIKESLRNKFQSYKPETNNMPFHYRLLGRDREEFWDFLGGRGTYSELLNCFERAGIELGPEIDQYFSKW